MRSRVARAPFPSLGIKKPRFACTPCGVQVFSSRYFLFSFLPGWTFSTPGPRFSAARSGAGLQQLGGAGDEYVFRRWLRS